MAVLGFWNGWGAPHVLDHRFLQLYFSPKIRHFTYFFPSMEGVRTPCTPSPKTATDLCNQQMVRELNNININVWCAYPFIFTKKITDYSKMLSILNVTEKSVPPLLSLPI